MAVIPFSTRWPPAPLSLKQTRSQEPAYADTPQALVGNAACMIGHTNGTAQLEDGGNPAPVSPSGQYGHDHSGGEFGVKLKRTIYAQTFDDFISYDTVANAEDDIAGPDRMIGLSSPAADASELNYSNYGELEFSFWVPAGVAYKTLGWILYVGYDGTTGSTNMLSSDKVTLRVEWAGSGASDGDGEQWQIVSGDLMPSPQTDGFKQFGTHDGALPLHAKPGAVNTYRLSLKVQRSSTAGNDRKPDLVPLSIEIGTITA